jgi:hypothetical protein
MTSLPRYRTEHEGGPMALSEKHRSTLYEYFAPKLGEEVTEAFIAQFPRGDRDEPVTREYLDVRLDALRGDLTSGLTGRITTVVLGAASIVIAAVGGAATIVIAVLR